ncbi:MAG TPA: glycoside hydrolase family 88 protein, partial [Rhizomicrobium sp.]|nr:glycoside hydrolase family 88 protein [Rhizomicrobium sp.]
MKTRFLPGVALAAFLLALTSGAQARDDITDAQIRDVVARVARHQLHPLSDGDYAPVTTLDAARAARPPAGLIWNYPQGVALYGMARSVELTGDREVDKFVVEHNQIAARYWRWLAGVMAQFGKPGQDFAHTTGIGMLADLGSLDSCGAMGNALLDSMMRHPESVTPEEKALAARIADWVANKQDRLPDGTLWRTARSNTVWPDDLYMGGVFLLRYGLYTNDPKYIDDAARNIIQQAALEQDADGLWYHGYFVDTKTHAPFKWARGNGWVTVTLVEVLSAMPASNPLQPRLLAILRKQIQGLKPLQAPSGLWRQVLDKPQLWEETSASAMFAYGIARAVHRGWLPASDMAVARHAFAGVAKNVTAEGAVQGTCAGTNIG